MNLSLVLCLIGHFHARKLVSDSGSLFFMKCFDSIANISDLIAPNIVFTFDAG